MKNIPMNYLNCRNAFALGGVCTALLAFDAHAQSYDLPSGFSATSNPNGPWALGWKDSVGGVFTPLTVPHVSTADGGVPVPSWQLTSFQTPAVYKNTSGGPITVGGGLALFPPETVWFYPGEDGRPENLGAVRFTVPTGGAGNYLVQTAVSPVYPSSPQGDTDFHVAHNGSEVFSQFLEPAGLASYSSVIALGEGDTIDFLIGRGADGSAYGSGLRISAMLTFTNIAAPPSNSSGIYRLADGFSAEQNPNGPWAYGWAGTVGGVFTRLTVPHVSTADGGAQVPSWQLSAFEAPAIYKNTLVYPITVGDGLAAFPSGTVWFLPGEDARPENFGVIRFTVPTAQSGHYQIKTEVSPVYPSSPQGDTDFHIVRNGTELFGRFLGAAKSAHSTIVLNLHEGDTIDFVIGRGADGSSYGSALRIAATLTLLSDNGH